MTCSHHDIVLLPIPFTDLSSRKVRPAIVIGAGGHPGDIFFVVPISSQPGNVDFPLADWRHEGLNVPCGVKSQIATVEDQLVRKILGRLSQADADTLNVALRRWLKL